MQEIEQLNAISRSKKLEIEDLKANMREKDKKIHGEVPYKWFFPRGANFAF